jgi:hypothetical protein
MSAFKMPPLSKMLVILLYYPVKEMKTDLNERPEMLKLLQEKIRRTLEDTEIGNFRIGYQLFRT